MKTLREYLVEGRYQKFDFKVGKENWKSFSKSMDNINTSTVTLKKFLKEQDPREIKSALEQYGEDLSQAPDVVKRVLISLAVMNRRSDKTSNEKDNITDQEFKTETAKFYLNKFKTSVPNPADSFKKIDLQLIRKGSTLGKMPGITPAEASAVKAVEPAKQVEKKVEEPKSAEETPEKAEEPVTEKPAETSAARPAPSTQSKKFTSQTAEVENAIGEIKDLRKAAEDKIKAADAAGEKPLNYLKLKSFYKSLDKNLEQATKARTGLQADPNDNSAINAANKAAVALIRAKTTSELLGLKQQLRQKDTVTQRIAGRFSDADKAVKERLARVKETGVGRAATRAKKAVGRAEMAAGIAVERKAKDIAQGALRVAKGTEVGKKVAQTVDKVKAKIQKAPAKATATAGTKELKGRIDQSDKTNNANTKQKQFTYEKTKKEIEQEANKRELAKKKKDQEDKDKQLELA